MDRPVQPLRWDVTERGIYFVDDNAKPTATICFLDLGTRAVSVLSPVSNDPGYAVDNGLSISNDGRWLVYAGGLSAADILMIDNFR